MQPRHRALVGAGEVSGLRSLQPTAGFVGRPPGGPAAGPTPLGPPPPGPRAQAGHAHPAAARYQGERLTRITKRLKG
ncbi:hypothetical protein ABZ054_35650, partial [Streptomyces sp. NPDC006324]